MSRRYRPRASPNLPYCVRARFYNPLWGRWLNPDPIGFEALPNRYAYVQNNPANAIDPSGLDWLDCMAACIEHNDPIKSFIDKAIIALAGQALPKSFVAALARAVGDETLARQILAGRSRLTTIPSALSTKLRLGGRSTLRILGRYAFWIWLAYGNALAAVEVHCAGYCCTASCYGIDYDPDDDRWTPTF